MISWARTRHIAETTDPEEAGARKKQVVASYEVGTKRQRVTQERPKSNDQQLAIYEGGQVMAVTEEVPKSSVEATTGTDSDEWKKAIASELGSLTANKTWKLVTNREGILAKAWHRQQRGVLAGGFPEFDPCQAGKFTADGFEIEQCDVDTAFFYGKLNGEIYMELPEELRELLVLAEAEGEGDVVYLLLQGLYGLKQTSRLWNETIDSHLKDMGFKATDADPCVYTTGEGNDECIVCLYVDEMLIAAKNKAIIASVKAGIAEKFKIKDLGRARFILGIKINYAMEGRTLRISQETYTESIIRKFQQESAKPCLTPLEAGIHLTKTDQPQTEPDKAKMSSKPYRSLVGSLLYLACCTRPDISNAVAQLSRFLENPGHKHWDASIRVVRYLLKTKDVGITCDGRQGTKLVAYSDADWAGNRDDRRSVSGLMLMMCGAPLVWRSTFQKTVALSSTEADCMALSDCVKEVMWMQLLLKDFGSEQDGGTVIYEDNQGAMALAKNFGYQASTKHIYIRYHFGYEW
ncbi:hypothetical protein PC120_g12286 [Phytophthora cactorum]|nr:hypothetical protein PC120_g12286 [Phytophthora cactorum]